MAAILAEDIFNCIFLNENDIIPIQVSLTYVPNWQKVSIGLGNGLAPNRRQAITWTNVDRVHWRIYAARGGGLTLRVPTVMFAKYFPVSNGFHIKGHVNRSIIIFGVFRIETYP